MAKRKVKAKTKGRPRAIVSRPVVTNVVRFRAIVSLGNTSAAGNLLLALPITNRMFGTTTTGHFAKYSDLYQQIKIRSIKAQVRSALSLSSPGVIVMAYDYDGTQEHVATDPTTTMALDGAQVTPASSAGDNMRRAVNYMSSQNSRGAISLELDSGAARNFNIANPEYLLVQVFGASVSVPAGFLVAEVEAELLRPKLS
jgi:hypothetical protein